MLLYVWASLLNATHKYGKYCTACTFIIVVYILFEGRDH